jgi:hypothetical protein
MTTRRCRRIGVAVAAALATMTLGQIPAAATTPIPVRVVASPIQVTVKLSPSSIKVGGDATATETVTNLAATGLSSVRYSLLVDASGLKVSEPTGPGSIGPRGQSTAKFSVCGLRAGSYLVQARVTATGPGGVAFVAVSPAQLLEVRSGGPKAICH